MAGGLLASTHVLDLLLFLQTYIPWDKVVQWLFILAAIAEILQLLFNIGERIYNYKKIFFFNYYRPIDISSGKFPFSSYFTLAHQ